jgi:hypothetical protein
MRKILLATTALVGFAVAGAAQAATSPLNVTVGGSVDFIAGAFHESFASGVGSGADASASGDFETVYSLAFGVTGKTGNGIEYGGNLVLDNDTDADDNYAANGSNGIVVTRADIFMSGAFGKVQLGDARGATDLAVTGPNMIGIRYLDFVDGTRYAKKLVAGVDAKDHSTNVTYYTPKIGNDMHKVQAAVTYVPNFTQYGSTVQLTQTPDYKNVVKGVVAYTGNFKSVAVNASADIINGNMNAQDYAGTDAARPFTAWGFGAQAAYDGFTVGATYTDMGHFMTGANTATGKTQDKDQHTFGASLKYEFSKVAVGFNYLGGTGYDNNMGLAGNDYVKSFNNYGFAGAYTWAPGLTTNANAVLFEQRLDRVGARDNDGYVLLISQKLTF